MSWDYPAFMSKFLSGAAFRSGSRKQRRNLDATQKQPEITQAIGFRDDDSPKVLEWLCLCEGFCQFYNSFEPLCGPDFGSTRYCERSDDGAKLLVCYVTRSDSRLENICANLPNRIKILIVTNKNWNSNYKCQRPTPKQSIYSGLIRLLKCLEMYVEGHWTFHHFLN